MTSIGRVWQAEGPAAVRDRLWDRARFARWRRTGWFASGRPWPSSSILNVIGVPIATQFGGVPLQLRARLMHEAAHRPIALLSREADGRLRLDAWEGERHHAQMFASSEWNGDPLVEHPHWLETLRTCCQLVRARAIHIENIAGLSLPSLARLADADESGLALMVSVHDFSVFCRRPNLWESSGRFCDYSTDALRCHTCLSRGGDGFAIDQEHHRWLAGLMLAAASPIVVPSEFMAEQLMTLCDTINPRALHVIAPGIDDAEGVAMSARHADRVAFIGTQDHKGGGRLTALAAALASRGVKVTVYGGYGHEHLLALRRIRGVRVRGYYRAGTLSSLLARDGIAAALILSQVPESFSLALSEAWAAGIPVVASDLGAFRERILEGVGGEVVPATACDADVLDALERVRLARDVDLPAVPTAEAAAEAHLALYRARRLIASS